MFWEFYKKGVASNVKSYINRLEKVNPINDNLLHDETPNEEDEDEDDNDEYELNENDKMSLDFRNALESIKAW